MSNLVAQFAQLSSSKRQIFTAELKKQGLLLPIAIVGIGCRFPGNAIDADSYWQLLKEGKDAITEVPAERWDANGRASFGLAAQEDVAASLDVDRERAHRLPEWHRYLETMW